MNKKMPRIYWDEKQQYYYITIFEDTQWFEVVNVWNAFFKGRTPKEQKEHDKHSN